MMIVKVIGGYRSFVEKKYPQRAASWPLASGCISSEATYKGRIIFVMRTGGAGLHSGLGELEEAVVGVPAITSGNVEQVRERLERHFELDRQGGIVISEASNARGEVVIMAREFEQLLGRHEVALGLVPMKIFLSHKGVDKGMVRRFYGLLKTLGFDPWLDEDAMTAGVPLDRSILEGFKASCAAVFFVTPNFVDEHFLAAEIDYAVQEERTKGTAFRIVTLQFSENGKFGTIPDLLRRFVWKTPVTELEAFEEIIRALPISVGAVRTRRV